MRVRDVMPTRGGPNDPCIEWPGSKTTLGYGRITIRGKWYSATRLITEAPDGLVVDHLCRNPGCVRKDHLELVPQKVNTQRGSMYHGPDPVCRNCGGKEFRPGRQPDWWECIPCFRLKDNLKSQAYYTKHRERILQKLRAKRAKERAKRQLTSIITETKSPQSLPSTKSANAVLATLTTCSNVESSSTSSR